MTDEKIEPFIDQYGKPMRALCDDCGREFLYPPLHHEYVEHSKVCIKKQNLIRYLKYWDKDSSLINDMNDMEFLKKHKAMLNKILDFNKEEEKLNFLEKESIICIISGVHDENKIKEIANAMKGVK